MGGEESKAHDAELMSYALKKLSAEATIFGTKNHETQTGIISFTLPEIHPHDIAEILNRQNIAVRAGHHCTMPLMDYLELSGTARVSFGIYNTFEDIDRLVEGIKEVKKVFTQ